MSTKGDTAICNTYLCRVNREFLFNIFFLVFINLLIKPVFIFGIDLGVQNQVGPAYGTYFALLNFSFLFQILNDFGIQNFNNRNISQHPQLLPKYFPNLLFLKILFSGVYFSVSLLLAWLVAGYGKEHWYLLSILMLNQVLIQMILFLRSNISGLGHYRLDSFLSALDKLLMLGTCGVLLWGDILPGPVTVERFALAQTVALVLTVGIVWVLLRQKVRFSIRPGWLRRPALARPALLSLIRKSLPFALVVLLMTAYTRLDGVLLERMLPEGFVHAEVYAGAYRILDASNMFGYLFATLLLPMFARMLRLGEPVRPLVSLSFKLIWAGSMTLATAVFFSRQELVELMMPERASAYRWDTLGILIWTFVPVCTTYIFSTLLTADEKLMAMNRFFVGGIVLDVILNLLLIPHWQAMGAAWAALGTQTFVAVSMVWLCHRFYGFRASIGSLFRIVGFGGWLLLADGLLIPLLGGPWWVPFLLSLGAGLAGLPLLGVFQWRQKGFENLRI